MERRIPLSPSHRAVPAACVALILAVGACGPRLVSRNIPADLAASADEVLPVKKVVLFQNGVAYLERRGKFQGDELRLRVRPSQIPDVLKSITVVDFKGGRARSLALPVDISSKRAMAELPKLALGQGSLDAILGALRGAWVRLETDDEVAEGRLVGVDPAAAEGGGPQISVLDRAGTIRLFARREVQSLRILDVTLAKGLEKGLDISLGQDAWQSVELTVYLNKGDRARDLLVSYLVEMPTWKPSYRLVLDDQGDPLLQGWAIIDNVSGADWPEVKLTLTTGSPVSFHYDLYTPRFVQRPDLTPYNQLGIAPPVAQSGIGVAPPSIAPPPPRPSSRPGRAGRSRAAAKASAPASLSDGFGMEESYAPAPEPPISSDALYSSMNVQASTQKVGSLYRFELADPMTVPNRSSTMIALLNSKVPGKAIYSYNPTAGVAAARQHPFRAVSLNNASGVVLEPGPISIIRNGSFVGEGLIQRIEKGHQTYIAYALDTAVNVTHRTNSSRQDVGLVKISRGVIETKSFSIETHTYEAQATGDDGEALPLMVSQPKRGGWEVSLDGGEKASETAGQIYYSMPVKPGDKTKLVITYKYPTSHSYRINDANAQRAILAYTTSGEAKPEVLAKLKPLSDKVRQLADTRNEITTLERKRNDLKQRANEIRQNLKLLKKSQNQKLKDEQMGRLMKVDREQGKITDKLVVLRDRTNELKVQLHLLIEQLEISF